MRGVLAVASAVVVAAAGCGSSATKSSPGAGHGTTYTIGVLTDLTGLASGDNQSLPKAIQAGVDVAASEGYHIRYVLGDSASSPAGALSAAQRLVNQDHVLAVIAISDLTFGAAPFLASKGVPVIGGAVDSTEWTTDRNMFSVFGYPDYTSVETTDGQFFKLVGATNVGAIGYGAVPSAADSAKANELSVKAAGLKAGYLNAEFPLGSTNVGPDVLQMKDAGIDGLSVLLQQNTAFAIINALRQQGVELKAPVLADGYGHALLDAGPGALQSAQGAYFSVGFEPIEMHTAATEKFARALTQAGFSGGPGLPEYLAYMSVDAFVAGLKAAGAHPTQAGLINAMVGIRKYDGAGLYGGHTVGFAMNQRGVGGSGADGCIWFTRFQGRSFNLVKGADPVCGTVVTGVKVS